MGKGVDKIAIGVLGQALQGHGTASGIPDQALQLVAPMGGDLGVGVERKALYASTAGTGQRRRLACVAKACANAPHPLASPLAKGNALLHRGRQGAGEFGGVIDQRIMAGRHPSIDARFQASQAAQCTDDTPPDVLDHGGVRTGRINGIVRRHQKLETKELPLSHALLALVHRLWVWLWQQWSWLSPLQDSRRWGAMSMLLDGYQLHLWYPRFEGSHKAFHMALARLLSRGQRTGWGDHRRDH